MRARRRFSHTNVVVAAGIHYVARFAGLDSVTTNPRLAPWASDIPPAVAGWLCGVQDKVPKRAKDVMKIVEPQVMIQTTMPIRGRATDLATANEKVTCGRNSRGASSCLP